MRRAVIDVDCEILTYVVAPLQDCGFKIVATLTHPLPEIGALRFIVESVFLPDRCESEKLIVKPIFMVETCENQRMTKLSDICIVGPYSDSAVS